MHGCRVSCQEQDMNRNLLGRLQKMQTSFCAWRQKVSIIHHAPRIEAGVESACGSELQCKMSDIGICSAESICWKFAVSTQLHLPMAPTAESGAAAWATNCRAGVDSWPQFCPAMVVLSLHARYSANSSTLRRERLHLAGSSCNLSFIILHASCLTRCLMALVTILAACRFA